MKLKKGQTHPSNRNRWSDKEIKVLYDAYNTFPKTTDAFNYCAKILGRSFTACREKITKDKHFGKNQHLIGKSVEGFSKVENDSTVNFKENVIPKMNPIIIKKGNSIIEITENAVTITM